LTAVVPVDRIAIPGVGTIGVVNPVGVFGRIFSSGTVTFMISPPSLSGITPNAAIAGSSALNLTVTGSGFVSASVVQWGGTALATAFINNTQLSATVPASALATPGRIDISVMNRSEEHTSELQSL
jgi:hypothetical protein